MTWLITQYHRAAGNNFGADCIMNRFSMATEFKRDSHYAITTVDAVGQTRVLFGPFDSFTSARAVVNADVEKIVGTITGLEDSTSKIRISETPTPVTGDFNEVLDARSQLLLRSKDEPPIEYGVFRANYSSKYGATFVVGTREQIAHHLSTAKGFYPITTPIPHSDGSHSWLSEKKDAIVRISGLTANDIQAINNEFKTFKALSPELQKPLAGTLNVDSNKTETSGGIRR